MGKQKEMIKKGSTITVPVFGKGTVIAIFTRKNGTRCAQILFADGDWGSAPLVDCTLIPPSH